MWYLIILQCFSLFGRAAALRLSQVFLLSCSDGGKTKLIRRSLLSQSCSQLLRPEIMKLHHRFPSPIHSLPPLIISSDLKEEKCSEERKISHATQVSQDVYHWHIRNAEVTRDRMSSTFTHYDFSVTLSPISRGFRWRFMISLPYF